MLENRLGQSFENLGKRITYSYLATYPEFKPVANFGASELSQRQMYDFLYETIETIYNNLSLINVADEPDDSYEWWQMNKDKPDLILKMRVVFFRGRKYNIMRRMMSLTSLRIFSLQAKKRLVAGTDCLSGGEYISHLVEMRRGMKNFLLSVICEANYRLLGNFSLNYAL